MSRMLNSVTHVLFVSREDACRGLLAEACLRQLGGKKFKVYSCGVPGLIADSPHGWTRVALLTAGIPGDNLQCKGWTEFSRNGAPKMDFVIALDRETANQHPSWKGQPETALWEYAAIDVQKNGGGNQAALDTLQTLHSLRRRIELLVSLHSRVRHRSELRHDLRDLGYA